MVQAQQSIVTKRIADLLIDFYLLQRTGVGILGPVWVLV